MGLSRRRLLGATGGLVLGGPVLAAGRRRAAAAAGGVPAHFLLVHGALHGAWCWYKVVAGLEGAGHRVTAVDLPSAGIDGVPAASVTLQAQVDRVVAVLDALGEPVVLVGHSAGGPVISMAADARPALVEKLVYVAAFLLPNGASMAVEASRDPDALFLSNLVVNPDGTMDVKVDGRREVFYGACSTRDVALAQALLKPIALRTTTDALVVGAGFAGVRRFYVTCRDDRAISAGLQQSMYTALPCERVFRIATDHSPFLSRPSALLRILSRIARA